jgi:hypothetical protein
MEPNSGEVGSAPFQEQAQVMYIPVYFPSHDRFSIPESMSMQSVSSRPASQSQIKQAHVLQQHDEDARDLHFQGGEVPGSFQLSGQQTRILITSEGVPPPSTFSGQQQNAFHNEVHVGDHADSAEYQRTQDPIMSEHNASLALTSLPSSPPTARDEQQENADSAASVSFSSAVGNGVRETDSRGRSQPKRGKKRKCSLDAAEHDSEASEKRAVAKSNSSRFLWSSDLHAQFCSSVVQVGLKQASPEAILNKMTGKDTDQVSTAGIMNVEQVTLYLDQYRKLQDDMFAARQQEWRSHSLEPPAPNVENSIQPGLTDIPDKDKQHLGELEYESLPSPYLRPEELNSPVGRAMGYLMGMVHCISSQVLKGRIYRNKISAMKKEHAESQDNQYLHIQHQPGVPRGDGVMTGQHTKVGRLTHTALIAGTELHSTLEQKDLSDVN